MYYEFMNIIKDKKLMAEILGLEETDDDIALIRAFIEQYGELWLAAKDRRAELVERLKERTIFVVNKRMNEENSMS